jgi:hypothetical protein
MSCEAGDLGVGSQLELEGQIYVPRWNESKEVAG